MNSLSAPDIRPATPADLPAVAQLAAATFVETFGHLYPPEDLSAFLTSSRSEAAYARMMQDPSISIWLASLENMEPVGYVVAGKCKLPVENLEPNAGEIRELYVRAGYQKLKLGTRLLEAALQWLASGNRAPVYVGVWSGNLGAQRFYARFGFEKVSEYDFPVGGQMDREFILEQKTVGLRRLSPTYGD